MSEKIVYIENEIIDKGISKIITDCGLNQSDKFNISILHEHIISFIKTTMDSREFSQDIIVKFDGLFTSIIEELVTILKFISIKTNTIDEDFDKLLETTQSEIEILLNIDKIDIESLQRKILTLADMNKNVLLMTCIIDEKSSVNDVIEFNAEIYEKIINNVIRLSKNDIVNQKISLDVGMNVENSTALDIMTIYLRGQKILHREAMSYSEKTLNMLSIPAIIINLLSSVVASLWHSSSAIIFIAVLCAVNTMLVAITNQLKLGEKTEAFRTSAYHYEMLETKCQFLSGKVMYVKNRSDLETVLKDIEEKITDTKKANQFTIPEKIAMSYPIIYNTNIFSKVKDIYIEETVLKNNLKRLASELSSDSPLLKEKLNEVVEFKKKYLSIDNDFNDEILRNDENKKSYYCLCRYCFFGFCKYYLKNNVQLYKQVSNNFHV